MSPLAPQNLASPVLGDLSVFLLLFLEKYFKLLLFRLVQRMKVFHMSNKKIVRSHCWPTEEKYVVAQCRKLVCFV